MKEKDFVPLGGELRVESGKTVFIVNSFADRNAENTAEQLIIQLLKSKVINNDTIIKEKSA